MDGMVFARMRDCACPGTPHPEGDGVWLTPTVSLAGGLALEADLRAALVEAATSDQWNEEAVSTLVTSKWLTTALRHCAVGWNLEDEAGPVPFDVDRLLADYTLARHVADAAADLYSETVLVPLAQSVSGASANGSSNGSTSLTARSTRKSPRRSSRATSAATKQSAA